MARTLPSNPGPRTKDDFDAIVVGAGPNGLASAITLAKAGWRTLVVEAAPTVGGGTRTSELTLPGFHHDVCSAIHPMAVASPFFREQPLAQFGLEWCRPEIELAHPLDDGTAVSLHRDVERTADELGVDARSYRRVFAPLVRKADDLLQDALAPFGVPRHPWLLARFGLDGVWSAQAFARRHFRAERARALFAGNAAHSVLPFDRTLSAATGMMLMISAHAYGWPVAKGGSASIARALAAYFEALGGTVRTGQRVEELRALPPARAVLCDVSPRALAEIAGAALPETFRTRLRAYRHGPAAFKLDWALSGPIPWRAEACRRAGTVHVGGRFEEVAAAEKAPWRGEVHPRPFVLVGQQSLIDATRAPAGRHTGWAYCHVPNGCTVDATEAIEAQIERFAPGFRKTILARAVMTPADFASYNANYVGGDIVGGVQDLTQLFTRPTTTRINPYTTPNPRVFLCSASTPPGAGVHGMCGWHAARAVIKRAGTLARGPW